MGSTNFFSKLASVDPLAQALHLPGSTKYAQQEANDANSTGAVGPYAGVTPTLAGANGGYAPGGPGSNPDWKPFAAQRPGGLFGFAQRAAAVAGDTTPNPADGNYLSGGTPSQLLATARTGQGAGAGASPYGPGPAISPYVTAAAGAGAAPVNTPNSMNNLFRRPVASGQPQQVWG